MLCALCIAEDVHGGRAKRQAHAQGSEGSSASGQAGGAEEASQGSGETLLVYMDM